MRILKAPLAVIFSVIGFGLLFYSCKEFIINFDELVLIDEIKDLLLPSILSFMFLIYIYVYVLYSIYEMLFIRLSFNKMIEEKLRLCLKIRILILCNININKINNFIKRSRNMSTRIESKNDIKELISNYTCSK